MRFGYTVMILFIVGVASVAISRRQEARTITDDERATFEERREQIRASDDIRILNEGDDWFTTVGPSTFDGEFSFGGVADGSDYFSISLHELSPPYSDPRNYSVQVYCAEELISKFRTDYDSDTRVLFDDTPRRMSADELALYCDPSWESEHQALRDQNLWGEEAN